MNQDVFNGFEKACIMPLKAPSCKDMLNIKWPDGNSLIDTHIINTKEGERPSNITFVIGPNHYFLKSCALLCINGAASRWCDTNFNYTLYFSTKELRGHSLISGETYAEIFQLFTQYQNLNVFNQYEPLWLYQYFGLTVLNLILGNSVSKGEVGDELINIASRFAALILTSERLRAPKAVGVSIVQLLKLVIVPTMETFESIIHGGDDGFTFIGHGGSRETTDLDKNALKDICIRAVQYILGHSRSAMVETDEKGLYTLMHMGVCLGTEILSFKTSFTNNVIRQLIESCGLKILPECQKTLVFFTRKTCKTSRFDMLSKKKKDSVRRMREISKMKKASVRAKPKPKSKPKSDSESESESSDDEQSEASQSATPTVVQAVTPTVNPSPPSVEEVAGPERGFVLVGGVPISLGGPSVEVTLGSEEQQLVAEFIEGPSVVSPVAVPNPVITEEELDKISHNKLMIVTMHGNMKYINKKQRLRMVIRGLLEFGLESAEQFVCHLGFAPVRDENSFRLAVNMTELVAKECGLSCQCIVPEQNFAKVSLNEKILTQERKEQIVQRQAFFRDIRSLLSAMEKEMEPTDWEYLKAVTYHGIDGMGLSPTLWGQSGVEIFLKASEIYAKYQQGFRFSPDVGRIGYMGGDINLSENITLKKFGTIRKDNTNFHGPNGTFPEGYRVEVRLPAARYYQDLLIHLYISRSKHRPEFHLEVGEKHAYALDFETLGKRIRKYVGDILNPYFLWLCPEELFGFWSPVFRKILEEKLNES